MQDIHASNLNALDRLFAQRGGRKLLAVYFCAGHPSPAAFAETLRALDEGCADIIEIGFPFSDPIADGPLIQRASTAALRQGMTLERLFGELRGVAGEIAAPIVLMGYLNPVMQMGEARFFDECQACGVSGVILPDLPPESDDAARILPLAEARGVRVVLLVTPETSEERVREIDRLASGFVYVVSTASTTGPQASYDQPTRDYFRRIGQMGLRNPLLVGFGVSNRQTLADAREFADGAIVGSQFIRRLDAAPSPADAVRQLREDLGL